MSLSTWEARMIEVQTHMNILPLQNLRVLKGSDHMAHMTRIIY
jgi:hypothetical protein